MPSPAVHVDMMETQPMDVPETLTVQAIATPLRNINIDGAGRQASKDCNNCRDNTSTIMVVRPSDL